MLGQHADYQGLTPQPLFLKSSLMITRLALLIALTLPMGCAVQNRTAPALGGVGSRAEHIVVAFSPEAGAEALVIKVISSTQQSLRLAGYSFTSPAVVRGWVDAKRRGIDVKVLLDDRGNRSQASISAMNLLLGAGIPLRVVSAYPIHHDKYIVVDGRHTKTGSFNFSQAAARSNSENVMVVWNNPAVANQYLAHWESRWKQGVEVEAKY